VPLNHCLALASEPVRCNAIRQVVVKLKTHWRDGTAYQVLSPLDSIQPLAALSDDSFEAEVSKLWTSAPGR